MTPAMTPEHDAYSAGKSPAAPNQPYRAETAPRDEAASLFQQINERRARVENAEMLRNLRGL